MQNPFARKVLVFWMMAVILVFGPRSFAVTILSGPTFTPATNAPLAGVLQVNTDVDSRLSVLMDDGSNVWERDFYDFSKSHTEPLLGFKPGRTNLILVAAYDKYRNVCVAPQLLTFVTGRLPADFPASVVLKSEPDRMEPGYTLMIAINRADNRFYITMMDNSGQVVWYCPTPVPFDVDVRQLDDGNLFLPQQAPSNTFVELNMLGQMTRVWTPPAGYVVNEHDGVPTGHGTILFLSDASRAVTNFPSSDTVSNSALKTVNIDDCRIAEISYTNSALLNSWSPLDVLDQTRVTYLTYSSGLSSFGVDNEHANALIEDTNDNDSILVSLRNQNAIYKFTRSGQLKWILGPPANWQTNSAGASLQPYVLMPVGSPFEWNYAEHSLHLTPQGTLLTYDDGNYRACPFAPTVLDQDNYSRGVEYSINETNMQVTQVWDTTAADEDRLFTAIFGETEWLPQTRDVLVTYGYVSYINGLHPSPYSSLATMARIIEYTHEPVPQVVFDLSFFDYTNTSPYYTGYGVYRALRVPDLYVHPANPVTDLVVNQEDKTPRLEFTADPARTYQIQASPDMVNWTIIGTAVPDGNPGDFGFDDLTAGRVQDRYYRVVTQ